MRKELLILAALAWQASAPNQPKRVFVIDNVIATGRASSHPGIFGPGTNVSVGEEHTAPTVMAEFMKRCPNVLVFTTDRETADVVLATHAGGSTLASPKGDVLFLSPARTLKNMAKDVCGYLTQH